MPWIVVLWLLLQVVLECDVCQAAEASSSLVRTVHGLEGLRAIRDQKFPALIVVHHLKCAYEWDSVVQRECHSFDHILGKVAEIIKNRLNVWTLSCSDHIRVCAHFGITAGIVRPTDPWLLGWSKHPDDWAIEAYTGAVDLKVLQEWILALTVVDHTESFLKQDEPTREEIQPDPAKFPKLFETAGIVLFLHVPKTGGTSLRYSLMLAKLQAFFQAHDNPELEVIAASHSCLHYIFCEHKRHFWNYAVPMIQNHTEDNHTVFVVEIHGRDNPTALELEPWIHTWREQLEVPVFAFSILRDPVAYQVSFFNYFILPPADARYQAWLEKGEQEFTMKNQHFTTCPDYLREQPLYWENVALHVVFPNPQCMFLALGEQVEPPQQPVNCQEVHQSLQRSMDWVGTTENLSHEALPLLTWMIWGSATLGRTHQKRISPSGNKEQKNEKLCLHVSQLDPFTVESLERHSLQDRDMYESVRKNYTIR